MTSTTTNPARVSVNFAAIAAALPGEWKGTTDEQHATDESRGDLIRADGLRIYATANGYSNRGKVTFSHARPTFKKGAPWVEIYGEPVPNQYGGQDTPKLASPSINCALTKTAEQMAADIARRMLADCERVEKLALAKIAQYEALDNAQLETLKAISSALGRTDIPRQYKSTEPRFELGFEGPNASGQIQVRGGGDCVHVEMSSLTRAQALSLIKWTKGNA